MPKRHMQVSGSLRITRFNHWKEFQHDLIDCVLPHCAGGNYIFRGHEDSGWLLESTFTRLKKINKSLTLNTHLTRFKAALRDRRGPNPEVIPDEVELQTLGQHFGLATTLLDWSESAATALFFAFANTQFLNKTRAVYALNTELYLNKCKRELKKPSLTIEGVVLQSKLNENRRVVSQLGMFTRYPENVPLDQWAIAEPAPSGHGPFMLNKYLIENKDPEDCLRSLQSMGTNFLLLFPDLIGAAKHCNLQAII